MDKVKDDIKEKGLSADDVYDHATWRCICHRTSTPHKSGNKMKQKKKQMAFNAYARMHACECNISIINHVFVYGSRV